MTSSDVFPLLDTAVPDACHSGVRHRRKHARSGRSAADRTEPRTSNNARRALLLSEQALIARLIKRDPAAWREFLERYERLIYSRVLAVHNEIGQTVQQDVIDDCCAEVLTALFQNDLAALKRFEGRSRFSTWLAVVARRVTLNYLLKRSRDADRTRREDSRFDLSCIAAPRVPTGLSGEIDQEEILLQACLAQLKETDQTVLKLHFEQRMSYEQIGRIMGISPNTVGPKLSRAAKRLRTLIERTRTTGSGRTGTGAKNS